jgi:hypothetical protein
MQKLFLALSAALIAALLAPTFGQAAPNNNLPSTPLRILWRVNPGSEKMSTHVAQERDLYPSDGAIFYLPKDNIAGTVPLWRLFQSSPFDHMDYNGTGVGGYTPEYILGYPWLRATPARGTSEVRRMFKSSTFDHATVKANEIAGFQSQGYSLEHAMGYGYARYNNMDTSLLSLGAGGVTIFSNGIAGGSLEQWWWNGQQFINSRGYGRSVQSVLFLYDGSPPQNPTEAGSTWSTDLVGDPEYVPPANRHGSPILNIHNDLSNPNSPMQVTRAVPLEGAHDRFGGDADTPVIYKDVILGKDIQLNYNNLGPVALYNTYLWLPYAIDNAQLYMSTTCLTGEFNTYYTYDAASQNLLNAGLTTCNSSMNYATNYGGLIISKTTDPNSLAMGVYGVNTAVGGDVSLFRMVNVVSCNYDNNGVGPKNKKTAIMSPLYRWTFPAGEKRFKTWLISGSLTSVQQKMRCLYCQQTGQCSCP